MNAALLASFYRQLATMADAGLPHRRSLTVLIDQRAGATSRLAGRLLAHLKQDSTLTEAFRAQGRAIPALHVALIHAGEISGKLDVTLIRLAEMLEQAHRMRRQFIARLIYPGLILHVAIGIMALVRYFLDGTDAAIRYAAIGYGLLWGIAAGFWLLIRLIRATPAGRAVLDGLLWHLPVVSGVARQAATGRFARTCEALYAAGIGLPTAVAKAAATAGNATLERRVTRALPIIQEGGDVATALRHCGAFSPMTIGMLQTGVESGRLDQMLRKIAQNAEEQAEIALDRLAKLVPFFIYMLIVVWIAMQIMALLGGYIQTIQQELE